MSRAEPGFAGFSKHTTGFGQKMLQKMGWEIGKGLGSGGEGIINPVETKLRPKGMGMGFKGFDERTSQAKEEARKKRGSEDEDEESEEEHIKKAEKREAWKSEVKKVRKIKVVYKTAKDILSEMTVEKAPMGQQKIIDMTGPTVKEVSLSDLRTSDSPTFIETTTQLPELRHNLRLLVDLAQGDLENLSKEKQANTIQMKEIETELNKIQRKVDASTDKKTQIEEIKKLTEQLERISKDSLSTGAYAVGNITALFGEVFDVIEKKYMEQVKTLGLDSMVVASWAPILKYKCIDWDVLSDPTWGADDVKRWRKLLPSHDDRDEEAWYDEPVHKSKAPSMATPYDTMMNTIWLSKVRSAINHHWDVRQPEPLISLFEVWKAPLLPRFITENIIDQLLLPKIANAVSDWDPRNDPDMVHTWIHPWLPVLEAWRLADIFTTIRQKLSTILSQWHPSDESALHIITPWKDVWTPSQMETFLTRSILPKLTQVLRHEFVVNPRDQQIEPLVWCLAWKDTISVTILCQLLENEFFVKWLDVLYKWLTLDRDRVNYDQVREWYLWWKGVFVAYDLYSCKVIAQCFRKGLDMMFMAGNGQTVVRPSLI
ncbi:GC-rich sequence DNA-binding factor-like protein-domain-containing protein [Spinellus fusiger]|nr:GC-rich sequence DNA-binding factor-like protein-domain-containing protein [Spinellus fusiger]